MFIGAKIEEIYPPKLSEFAYVTDGACSEDEILTMELVILKELNWGLSPMTPNGWIKLYMQVSNLGEFRETGRSDQVEVLEDDASFVTPQFSGLAYVRVMQLLDLAVLDVGSMSFRYSVLAASALAHCHGRDMATAASGYSWQELSSCAEWLSPFASALSEERFRPPAFKPLQNVSASNHHNIQTHSVDLSALDRAHEIQVAASRCSPDLTSNPELLLVDVTPPEVVGDIKLKQQHLLTPMTSVALVTTSSGQQQPSVFFSPETPTNSSNLVHQPLYHRSAANNIR